MENKNFPLVFVLNEGEHLFVTPKGFVEKTRKQGGK